MQKKLMNRFFFLLSIGLLVLFGAACGQEDSQTGGETQTPDNPQSQAVDQEGADEQQGGGSVVVAVPQDPDSLDPHLSSASGTYEMMFNVFEGLLKPDQEGNVYPALAEDYQVSEDGLTYTFTLRSGVKFHNGQPLTVEDVRYTFERLMGTHTGEPLTSAFDNVASIETPDERTVVFTLSEVDTSFLTSLTREILPANYDKQGEHPIGTGPFQFVEYLPEQRLVLKKFEEYWVEDVPYLDRVEFRIFPDGEAALLSFRAGEIDMYPRIGNERIEELDPEKFNVVQGMQNMVQLMTMNMAREPFDDVRVRQAINYAIDVDEIIDTVAFGYGTKLGSNMSPVMSTYYQEGLEDTYNQDLDKAKQLLAEAGYENGFQTTISVPSNYQFHVDTAQVIAAHLKQVGIDANIELVEWGVWLERIYRGRDYEMTIIGLTGKLDPHQVLVRYASDYAANFYNFQNERYDELIEMATKEVEPEKRAELYKEAQRILTDEAAAVYIMDPNFTVAMKKNLEGYTLYPLYIQDMSTIYYTE